MKRNALLTLAVLTAVFVVTPATLNAQVTVEAAVARSIQDRMPVDTASTFPSDVGTLWLWTNVTGAEGQTLSHVWKHGGNEWTVQLSVGAPRWRTWSSKVIPPEWTGEWTVEVRDSSGRVLTTVNFTVSGM